MCFLKEEIKTLGRYYPILDDELARIGLERLEKPDGISFAKLKEFGVPRFLIDSEEGQSHTRAQEFVHIMSALGRRAPSMAVASCMHHYKIAALQSQMPHDDKARGIYERLARCENLLLASGGAEGKLEQHLYRPSVQLSTCGNVLVLNGSKRPCSLSRSMTHLSGMAISTSKQNFAGELVHFFIDAKQKGVTVRPFWRNPVLSATESDEVTLSDALVSHDDILPLGTQTKGNGFAYACYGWFELGACASYMGVLVALFESAIQFGKPSSSQIGEWSIYIETLREIIRSITLDIKQMQFDQCLLARTFRTRYAVEKIIQTAAISSFSYMGGIGFGTSPVPTMLLNICLALQFHPPRRHRMEPHLAEQLLSGRMPLA